MILVAVLLIAAVVLGGLAAVTAWRHPALDPSSPRAAVPAARAVERRLRRDGPVARMLRDRLDPRAATGLLLSTALIAVVLLGVLVVQVRSGIGVVSLDRSIERWADGHATAASRDVLNTITDLGTSVVAFGFALVVFLVVGLVERRRMAPRRVFVFLVVALGGQWVATQLIKSSVGRSRPVLGIAAGLDGSFPSGHTANAAVAYAACALVLGLGRSRRVQAALTGGAVAIAIAVAGSRVLLGLHWFSDVVGGLVLGWTWFVAIALAFGGRLLRFGAPIEAAERHEALVTDATVAPLRSRP